MVYCNDDYDICFANDRYISCEDTISEREYYCPICGTYDSDVFYINDEGHCVGCSECVHEVYEL